MSTLSLVDAPVSEAADPADAMVTSLFFRFAIEAMPTPPARSTMPTDATIASVRNDLGCAGFGAVVETFGAAETPWAPSLVHTCCVDPFATGAPFAPMFSGGSGGRLSGGIAPDGTVAA